MIYGKTYGDDPRYCDRCGESLPKHAGECHDCKEPGCEACMEFHDDKLTCQGCQLPLCPNCGRRATFTPHGGDFIDTHGLDCGPYEEWHEEWLTCDKCGAKTDEKELANETI